MKLFSVVIYLCFISLCFPSCVTAKRKINVLESGVTGDGKTDDSEALSKVFKYCLENNLECYMPKTENSYLLTEPIEVSVPNNGNLSISSNGATIIYRPTKETRSIPLWKLTPQTNLQEVAILSFGTRGIYNNGVFKAFDSNTNSSVSINGIKILADFDQPKDIILVGIDLTVSNLNIRNVHIDRVNGFGIRSFGGKKIDLVGIRISDVGGRNIPEDSFGDGIYIASLKKDALININKSNLVGRETKGNRSRCGITFEFNLERYSVNIREVSISKYAKSIHIEDKSKSIHNYSGLDLKDCNYALATVMNNEGLVNISNSRLRIDMIDENEGGDGGIIINQNGAKVSFSKTTFDFLGKEYPYISMSGVQSLTSCTINANNKNPMFADNSVLFDKCIFNRFGGNFRSFYSVSPTANFILKKCKIRESSHIFAEEPNATIKYIN